MPLILMMAVVWLSLTVFRAAAAKMNRRRFDSAAPEPAPPPAARINAIEADEWSVK